MALHDVGVLALAEDLRSRTSWRVAAGAPGFPPPESRAGRPPDVLARRDGDAPPLALEVELPETLVRRETVARLAHLSAVEAMDARVVLIAPDRHQERIREASRLLRRAGLDVPVAVLAPETSVITGADW